MKAMRRPGGTHPPGIHKYVPANRTTKGSKSTVEVCILAGGKSRRMGTNKAALLWNGRTFLAHARRIAREAGFDCRAIRKDRGPSCGPVSGIHTGLLTTRAGAVMFLPCDMPLLAPSLLRRMASRFWSRPKPLFAATAEGLGFPLILPVASLPIVSHQVAAGIRSLQQLATALRATRYKVPRTELVSLANINTPADLATLQGLTASQLPGLSARTKRSKLRPMKLLALGGLLVLAGSCLHVQAEWIQLKENHAIVGKVIGEKRDQIFVDVGYTILVVPRNQVTRVSDEPPAAGATTPSKKQSTRGPAPRTAPVEARPVEVPEPAPPIGDRPVRELVGELGESVVQVRTPSSLGSGFILEEEGLLITNFHVIENETQLSVEVYHQKDGKLERTSYKQVRIVALNKFADLALLKIEDPGAPKFKKVGLADSDGLSVGEAVFAIGSPLGLERTVTEGIVSTKTRPLQGELYIQTTTQINPGNSGGPLFNLRGEVVGVTNMKMTFGEGLGFAIPVDTLRRFLQHQDAYAYDNDNPSNPYRYLPPPGRTRTAAEPAGDIKPRTQP